MGGLFLLTWQLPKETHCTITADIRLKAADEQLPATDRGKGASDNGLTVNDEDHGAAGEFPGRGDARLAGGDGPHPAACNTQDVADGSHGTANCSLAATNAGFHEKWISREK